MSNTFCTVITEDYVPYAKALLNSLKKHSSNPVKLEVLVSTYKGDSLFEKNQYPDMVFSFIEDLKTPIAKKVFENYYVKNMDAYRWSMKPVFINHLIEQKGYTKVIFLDSDIFFYENPQFLFDLLDKDRVILTPHWRCAENPIEDFHNFKLNFKDGIFNAGFVGVRKDAVEVMNFWANLCLTACEINRYEGLFVDQKYLDILHSRFEGVGVVRHKGCNVSNWNITDCKREISSKGGVLINGTYPVIFIHFTGSMMRGVLSGADSYLFNHFVEYSNALHEISPSINLLQKTQEQLIRLTKQEQEVIKKRNSFFEKTKRKIKKLLTNKFKHFHPPRNIFLLL